MIMKSVPTLGVSSMQQVFCWLFQLAKTTAPVETPPLSQERGRECLASQSLLGQDLNWHQINMPTQPAPNSSRVPQAYPDSPWSPIGKDTASIQDNTCHQASIHACHSRLYSYLRTGPLEQNSQDLCWL